VTMTEQSVPMIVPLGVEFERQFADFLLRLAVNGDEATFHPHALTREAAAELVRYRGRDLYYAFVDEEQVLAYGMLRGWDQGFDIPSLGIAVDPSARGCGIGLALMYFLQAVARRRGSASIRLTVAASNRPAIKLYERLGYRFEPYRESDLLGILSLTSA